MLRRLTVTFTPAESIALDRLAQLDVRPVKHQIRALVRAEAERRNVWLDDPAGPAEAASPGQVVDGGARDQSGGCGWLMGRSADEPIP